MQIKFMQWPPNIDKIREHFPDCDKPGVIFTYAPDVYVPNGEGLTKALIAHEQVHLDQQGDDPEGWWDRYFVDKDFRYAQELQAHRAEYKAVRKYVKDRNKRAVHLHLIAMRLASPLYGCVVSLQAAKKAIKRGR